MWQAAHVWEKIARPRSASARRMRSVVQNSLNFAISLCRSADEPRTAPQCFAIHASISGSRRLCNCRAAGAVISARSSAFASIAAMSARALAGRASSVFTASRFSAESSVLYEERMAAGICASS